MELNLCWRGPIQSGNFPTDPDAVEFHNQAGIYLRAKLYEGGRTIAYVGQSGHLITRFDQHLTRILSLQQPLRDESGLVVDHGIAVDRFVALNNAAAIGPVALAEVLRTQFYFALALDGFDIDYLTLIEAMLKARAEEMMQDQPENIQGINPGDFDHDLIINSDFSNVDAVGRQLIESIIGESPIEIAAAQEYFADAD
ncbi:MAG: hypothetical protein GKS01_06460 [Alphaproteobacteria bacterium]|nr:hypothetical protein [Alphaproteobacteria bacterium]